MAAGPSRPSLIGMVIVESLTGGRVRRCDRRVLRTRRRSARSRSAAGSAIRLGLGRTRAILRELGDPQRTLRGALVAGTNGKGSVLAMAGSVLRAAGLRVGETPKPHLVTLPRAPPGRRPPDRPGELRPARGRGDPDRRPGGPAPGRPDRVRAPHGRRLPLVRRGRASTSRSSRSGSADGSTRPTPGMAASPWSRTSTSTTWTASGRRSAHIAREKAAIIERGDRAVTGATGRRARDRPPAGAAARRAAHRGRPGADPRDRPRRARRRPAGPRPDAGRAARAAPGGERGRRRRHARCARRGRHRDRRRPRPARTGFATARWPGRLELLTVDGRDVLLDGAHNPAGAAALAQALDDLRPFLTGGDAPAAAPAADHAPDRLDGRQGRRRGRPRPRRGGGAAGRAYHLHRPGPAPGAAGGRAGGGLVGRPG